MGAPLGVIHVFEAQSGIQAFGRGIALVHQQPRRQLHPAGLAASGLEQCAGNTLPTMACGYGQAVYIQLARLRLVIHCRMVYAKSRLRPGDESLSQPMKLRAVVAYAAAHDVIAIQCHQCVRVGILRIRKLHKTFHQAMEVGERVAWAREILATLMIHGFHDERCNHIRLFWNRVFYLYHIRKIKKAALGKYGLRWFYIGWSDQASTSSVRSAASKLFRSSALKAWMYAALREHPLLSCEHIRWRSSRRVRGPCLRRPG